MGELRFKETFPGSGVTKSGARINPNMPDYGNSPCLVKKRAQAKAAWEDPGFQRLLALCKKKQTAQMQRSPFRKICSSIK